MEVPLTALREGETGVITSIKVGSGCAGRFCRGIYKRLEDMGLTPGTKVTMLKSAPFHGPVEIYVRGYRLALGRGMAERIIVEVQR
ncbi:MAG: FeoA family protein [Candidatus Bathyarchaeia archaeon]|nr:ferrous iron transport protein A [Candidatus Bathyarchaeota archaeon]